MIGTSKGYSYADPKGLFIHATAYTCIRQGRVIHTYTAYTLIQKGKGYSHPVIPIQTKVPLLHHAPGLFIHSWQEEGYSHQEKGAFILSCANTANSLHKNGMNKQILPRKECYISHWACMERYGVSFSGGYACPICVS